jgi:isoleucyl-tRNA synthetase
MITVRGEGMRYPSVDPQPKFPEIEERVLAFWERDRTFPASVDARPAGENGSNEFVFYDGPPFANGLPHYGHILTGYVKDAVPRYQTMRGHRVERRFGWDTHGLPAEVEAERLLGLSGHREIEEYGVAAFNDVCRTSVLQYTREWQRYVNRQARWVDFDNDYKTLDLSYMESVLWAFKTLWDRGLVYEGYRVLAYCWRCETPLSNTETRMDDVYRDRQDPALTVWFELDDGRRVLAWTTTPWTLPSNLALAVGPDMDYVEAEEDGHIYVLAAARVDAYERELANATVRRMIKGRDLVGHRYYPLFDFFTEQPNAFQVIGADFVSTEEGTGVVHLAPGFGEDDQVACADHDIDVVCPMDAAGRFTAEVSPWAGMHVFDANPEVARALKERGRVVRHETYDHSYPHCWRCSRPLVYRAVSSWFVQVTKFRDRMVELNQDITWVPDHIRDGSFGKWLEHARDWSISRNRFWGSPIPVWKSDDSRYPRIDVYGSLAELERDFGVRVTDLHRPAVDDLARPNPDDPTGQSMMRRVPEVLDCWFESGSMPYAQVHYPFENSTWFEHHYPGDFIVEYIGQTRGWFYTLHVLATALFDRPAFKACMSHGIVLGTDGQKASKSLRNYVDPFEMFDTYGSDAVRWFLLSSPVLRGADLIVNEQGIRDAANQVLRPLWNAWSFFALYANAEDYTARLRTDQHGVLDRYLLAKLHELVASVTERMDTYDLFGACALIRGFLDALTNWYIRRSRNRFWDGDGDAFDTLYTALHVLSQVAAPLLPLVTEELYQGLTGERSVHLTDWPDAAALPADPELVAAMDRVRDVCSAALSVRKARGLRVRLPLATLDVVAPGAPTLTPFSDLIKDEVNVKDVRLTEDIGDKAAYELKLVPAALGPRLGPSMQDVMRAYKRGEYELVPGRPPVVGGVELLDGEAEVRLVPTAPESSATLPGGAGIVHLDTAVTPALEAEGQARDLVRTIQQARRDAGLHVSDRIVLSVRAASATIALLAPFQEFVAGETLATATSWIDDDGLVRGEVEVEVERA